MDNKSKLFNINSFHRLFLDIFGTSRKLMDLYADKQLKQQIFIKSENEKFTSVDWVLQKMMENQLAKNFSSLKIIGEEDTKTTHSEIQNEKLFEEFLVEPTEFISDKTYGFLINPDYTSPENELNYEDLCSYIDPIDSTSSLIKYKFHPVTCLVGVTLKGQAHLGLIFFPWYKGENNPTLFFNIPKKGLFKYTYNNEKIEKIERVDRDYFHFAITESRVNETQLKSNILSYSSY